MSISVDRATPYAPAMLLDVGCSGLAAWNPSTSAQVSSMRPQLTAGT